jgi:hypothetical protein
MSPTSDHQKRYRYLLPAVFICLLVVLVSISGCITGLPGLSGISLSPGSGSSTGAANPPAYDTSQAQATGTAVGSCRQGLTSCAGNCVDITVDIGNCGGCGMVCPSNAQCNQGACFCKDGYGATAEGTCIPVTVPTAETANTGQNQQYSCAKYPGTTACDDGYCWYLTEDNHCGSCGNACSIDQTCVNGQCSGGGGTAQPSGSCDAGTWCPNMCTNLNVDNRNCGSCGNICASNEACFNGVCTPTSCANQAWSCSGHCALLAGDMPPLNCGGCGIACPSGQLCYSGICKDFTSILPSGTHVCGKYFGCKQGNDDPCKEIDTTTTFCGYGKTLADGGTLPFLNCCSSGQTCVNGQCQGGNCGTGLTSCNGACVNTQTDASNCGQCGNSCSTGRICSSGNCIINPALLARTFCQYPSTSCSGNCVNTQTDATNCGLCGTTCPTGGSCSSGVCVCPIGYINSNGVCSKLQVGVTLSSYKRIVSNF